MKYNLLSRFYETPGELTPNEALIERATFQLILRDLPENFPKRYSDTIVIDIEIKRNSRYTAQVLVFEEGLTRKIQIGAANITNSKAFHIVLSLLKHKAKNWVSGISDFQVDIALRRHSGLWKEWDISSREIVSFDSNRKPIIVLTEPFDSKYLYELFEGCCEDSYEFDEYKAFEVFMYRMLKDE